MLTEVIDLQTMESSVFELPPADAVIAAHAESIGDKDKAHWGIRYARKLIHSTKLVYCGDFVASLTGKFAQKDESHPLVKVGPGGDYCKSYNG